MFLQHQEHINHVLSFGTHIVGHEPILLVAHLLILETFILERQIRGQK